MAEYARYESSTQIVNLLSEEIRLAMRASSRVGWNSTGDTDADAERLRQQATRAAKLRIMRADYEQIMYGEFDD